MNTLKKYAIYARFSSDKQNPNSCEDQVTACNTYINCKNDGVVVGIYSDEGVSGAVNDRNGLNQLLQDAKQGVFDILVVESQDRISRSQSYMAYLYDVFDFLNITIHSLQEQEIDDTKVAIYGLMSSQYLKSLSAKTKRGHHSAISRGILPLKPIFGYVKNPDKTWSVAPDQAKIIQRIFDLYIHGVRLYEIVHILNTEYTMRYNHKHKKWTTNQCRAILNRRLYMGEFIWGCQERKKDPTTGNIVLRDKPHDTLQIYTFPHLSIVSHSVFKQAQRKMTHGPMQTKWGTSYALHQKVYCGNCGSRMHIWKSQKKPHSYIHFVCPAKDRAGIGICSVNNDVDLHTVTDRVYMALLSEIKNNRTLAKQKIQQHYTGQQQEFGIFKDDIIKKISISSDMRTIENLIQQRKNQIKISVPKLIKNLENAINIYTQDYNNTAITILQWFIEQVHINRTAKRDTKKFEFTYEIDWANIAKNLDRLQ